MNQQAVNPYAAPVIAEDHRQQLLFNAVIEESDYVALLGRRNLQWLLLRVLFALLTLVTLITLPLVFAAIISGQWDSVLVPACVLGMMTALGMVFVYRYMRPAQVARRSLKRQPDLLGIARGRIEMSGVAFHDGTRQHWFGPQHLIASQISAAGIRIPMVDDPTRYLALTKRMFDHYDEQIAMRLQESWLRAAAIATPSDEPAGIKLWQELNPMPADGIAFQGALSVQLPNRTPQLRSVALIELISSLLSISMGLFGDDLFPPWPMRVFLVTGTCGLVGNGVRWWRYFFGASTRSWNQRGWIGSGEIAIMIDHVGTRFPMHEFNGFTDYGAMIGLDYHGRGAYFLARDHFQSDEQWQQVGEHCRKKLSTLN